jgi:hypothetical protein
MSYLEWAFRIGKKFGRLRLRLNVRVKLVLIRLAEICSLDQVRDVRRLSGSA